MYQNEFLMIIWDKEKVKVKDKIKEKRHIDLLPSRMIFCPFIESAENAKHGFVSDEGQGFNYNEAVYDSVSMDTVVDVNYTNDFNREKEIYTGTMKLVFDSISKNSLIEICWKEEGEEHYKKCSANAKWLTLEKTTIAAQKAALNEISKWLAWK